MSISAAPPIIVDSPPRSGSPFATFVRRAGALLIAFIAFVMLTVGSLLHATSAAVSSPEAASSELIIILTQPAVSHALAEGALNDISNHSSGTVAAAIAAHRPALVGAIVTTLNDATTQAIIRNDVALWYSYVENQSTLRLDLRPLIDRFMSAIHQAVPGVPKAPPTNKNNYTVTLKKLKFRFNPTQVLTPTAWLLTVGGSLAVILAARFLVRNRKRRLIYVGLGFALPALLILSSGRAIAGGSSHLHESDPTAEILARNVFHRLGSLVTNDGLWLLGEGAVVLLIWFVARHFNDARHTRATTNGESLAPTT